MRLFRIKNPSGGQIALAAGAAIIAGLGIVGIAKAKSKKKKKKVDDKPIDNGEKIIADELTLLISEEEGPGTLYQIRSGDSMAKNVRAVFDAAGISDAKDNQQARVDYMKCISSSQYNRALFGNAGDFTTSFPSYTSPDNVSIRSAYLNKSADYISVLLNDHIPTRTSGGRLGLLWLPNIDIAAWQQFSKIVCTDIEPPPLAL